MFGERSNRDTNLFEILIIIELDHTHADKFCQDINEIKNYGKCAFSKIIPWNTVGFLLDRFD